MELDEILQISKDLEEQAYYLIDGDEYNEGNSNKNTIAVYGLLNAGKSSLLNALIGSLKKENEFFKTGDIRITTDLKKFEDDDYIYLDTPGLDANDSDTKLAEQGIDKGDIVLFVHQVPGELDAIEIECLKNLIEKFGSFASDNIIIVISKYAKERKNIDEIRFRILEQCRQLDFNPKCFCVESNNYKKGVLENKQALIKDSHIIDLKKSIDNISVDLTKLRDEKLRQKIKKDAQNILDKIKKQKILLQSEKEHKESLIFYSKNAFQKLVSSTIYLQHKINKKIDKYLKISLGD